VSDPALEARSALWRWVQDAEDPDPEQRAWKLAHMDGMVLAAERVGVLDADEVARWREVVAGRPPVAPPADRASAEAHLRALLAEVRPMSRDDDPERRRASNRFHGALGALHEAGVLDEDERAAWHARELRVSAPWLDADAVGALTAPNMLTAIGIPAHTPEEEASDRAAAEEIEAISRRGRVERVVAARSAERHDGLAVVAVAVRSECTDVVFHHVGPPMGEAQSGFASLEAFRAVLDSLVAPALGDDRGTAYTPVSRTPVTSHGAGGMPDPERRRVVTGVWRYAPSAPAGARRFTAQADRGRWAIGGQPRAGGSSRRRRGSPPPR
jgi:hypothetical protein